MSSVIPHKFASVFVCAQIELNVLILVLKPFLKEFSQSLLREGVLVKNHISIIFSYSGKWNFCTDFCPEFFFEISSDDFIEMTRFFDEQDQRIKVVRLVFFNRSIVITFCITTIGNN